MKKFVNLLKTEILNGLPGAEVQWQMASSDRMVKNFPRSPGQDGRVAFIFRNNILIVFEPVKYFTDKIY